MKVLKTFSKTRNKIDNFLHQRIKRERVRVRELKMKFWYKNILIII